MPNFSVSNYCFPFFVLTGVIMTRTEYMAQSNVNGLAAHRAYYAQFVNKNTINQIVSAIGAKRIKASTNPHFNDIPLKEWDIVAARLIIAKSFASFGDYPTLAGLVCIAKEAAKQFQENKGFIMSAFILSDKHFSAIAYAVMPDNAQSFADKLKAINIDSVNFRYSEKTRKSKVKLDNSANSYNPAVICKLIDCWDYQSCENHTAIDFLIMKDYLDNFKKGLSEHPYYDESLSKGIWSI